MPDNQFEGNSGTPPFLSVGWLAIGDRWREADAMSRFGARTAVILMAASVIGLLGGCGRGNGLPGDLTSHLAGRGIQVKPIQSHAPLSGRGGYVIVRHNPTTATNLIAAFKLGQVPADDRQFRWVVERVGSISTAKEIWGAVGRPAQLKLKNGGQLEYFYLLITTDGRMYLLAEYAYG
jgi:hypothetical protein